MCYVWTLMVPDHTAFQVLALGGVVPEVKCFWRWPLHMTPREGSGSLSMQPVGCTQWCSSDNQYFENGRSKDERLISYSIKPQLPNSATASLITIKIRLHLFRIHLTGAKNGFYMYQLQRIRKKYASHKLLIMSTPIYQTVKDILDAFICLTRALYLPRINENVQDTSKT